jgi:hypothetical protein
MRAAVAFAHRRIGHRQARQHRTGIVAGAAPFTVKPEASVPPLALAWKPNDACWPAATEPFHAALRTT